MKRFRLIFHLIYVLTALVILYFSVDILVNTEAYLSKVKLSSYIKLPRYVMSIFLFVSIIMIAEYVLQQFALRSAKSNTSVLESEVLKLKARLYDQEHLHDDDVEKEGASEESEEGSEENQS